MWEQGQIKYLTILSSETTETERNNELTNFLFFLKIPKENVKKVKPCFIQRLSEKSQAQSHSNFGGYSEFLAQ